MQSWLYRVTARQPNGKIVISLYLTYKALENLADNIGQPLTIKSSQNFKINSVKSLKSLYPCKINAPLLLLSIFVSIVILS